MMQGSIHGRDKKFFFSKSSRQALGAHPSSCSTETWGSSPGLKQPDHEIDHLTPSSVRL